MPYRFFTLPAVWALIAMNAAGAAERATANGKVVAADGKPVEHATVLVYEAWTRNGYSVYCPTCWVDCGKRTITNAEGKFSISGLNPDLVFQIVGCEEWI